MHVSTLSFYAMAPLYNARPCRLLRIVRNSNCSYHHPTRVSSSIIDASDTLELEQS